MEDGCSCPGPRNRPVGSVVQSDSRGYVALQAEKVRKRQSRSGREDVESFGETANRPPAPLGERHQVGWRGVFVGHLHMQQCKEQGDQGNDSGEQTKKEGGK